MSVNRFKSRGVYSSSASVVQPTKSKDLALALRASNHSQKPGRRFIIHGMRLPRAFPFASTIGVSERLTMDMHSLIDLKFMQQHYIEFHSIQTSPLTSNFPTASSTTWEIVPAPRILVTGISMASSTGTANRSAWPRPTIETH